MQQDFKQIARLSLLLTGWLLCAPLMADEAEADGGWWRESWWSGNGWSSAEPQPRVQVAVPYLEWRSGPTSGHPVVRVSEQGEWLELLLRKTQWLKVRDSRGREGWVHVADLNQTRDGDGQPVQLAAPRFDDFNQRSWEAGLMFGEFDRAAVTSLYAGYWMTANIAAEVSGSQALSDAAETLMVNASLLHQPFPQWRVSPFFTLGVGQLFIDPKATLAEPDSRDHTAAHVGLGLRIYLTDHYFARIEVKDYKVFTNRETNEEATEWKLGLSVFF